MSEDGSIIEVIATRIKWSADTAHLFGGQTYQSAGTHGALAISEVEVQGWQTYNFEVEDLHTYVADGVRVHNISAPWAHESQNPIGLLRSFEKYVVNAKLDVDYAAELTRSDWGVENTGGANGNPVGYTSSGRAITLDRSTFENFIDSHGGDDASPTARAEAAARAAIAAGGSRADAMAAAYNEAQNGGVNTDDPGFASLIDRAVRDPDTGGSGGKPSNGNTDPNNTPSNANPGSSGKGNTGTDPQDDTTSNPGSTGKGGGGGDNSGSGNPGGGGASGKSGSGGGSGSGSGSNSSGGGGSTGKSPVLLDLQGNGFDVNPLTSSHFFADLNGDGQQTRMAWAGAGTGVLVIDADGDGKISQEKEFAFTEWDANAEGDLEAIKNVFDTNHNGKLDAGDARCERVQGLGQWRSGDTGFAWHHLD